MSHLDTEFKKQVDPAVRMLIESQVCISCHMHSILMSDICWTVQFQGSQVYGTFCHGCRYKSERTTDFLEVEVSFDVSG